MKYSPLELNIWITIDRMMKHKLFLMFGILFLLSVVSAEQTVKTVEFPLDYIAQAQSNQNYIQTLTVNSPDGINKIISFEIQLNGDFQATTEVIGRVSDGINIYDCEPNTWTMPPLDATSYFMSFDCTDLVNQANFKGGEIMLGFRTNKIAQNIKPRIKMTYQNDPNIDIEIHGTEYVANQEGKTFIQLLDEDSNPIDNSTCFTSIYYPNNDVWQYQQAMSYLDEGIYKYDFTVPYQAGVYPISAFCTIPSVDTIQHETFDGFESGDGTGGTGNWSGSWDLDGCIVIDEDYWGGGWGANTGTYFLECIDNQNPERDITAGSQYTFINYEFYWRADELENDDYITYYLQDANGTNYSLKTITDDDDDGVWHEEIGTLYDDVDGFDFDGTIKFFIGTSGSGMGTNDWFEMDDLKLTLNSPINETNYKIVRGSGEVHVTTNNGEYKDILRMGELTNKSLEKDFTFHYDVISQTSQNKTGQEIVLELWEPFPCDNVLNVTEHLPNGTIKQLSHTGSINELDRCEVVTEIDLNVGQTHKIKIITENNWKKELYYNYYTTKLQSEMINISCQNYVMGQNMSNFTIPITEIPNNTDSMWLSCLSYLNKYNHYNEINSEFFAISEGNFNFTLTQMKSFETDWRHMESIVSELNSISNTIFNGLNLANSYSLGLISDPYPPTNPLYAKHFATVSTSYLSYVELGLLPSNVWTFGTRNLTWYNMTDSQLEINNSKIADFVWNNSDRYTHGIVA